MWVVNVHERELPCSAAEAGSLLDSLASKDDRLWPKERWPPMRFTDRGPSLSVGLRGGHGPIRYEVEAYEPGRSVTFRFLAPRGFDGVHRLLVDERGAGDCVLRHEIRMHARGIARLIWPLVIRPLHDALLEDALDKAEGALGGRPRGTRWSWWVTILRWVLSSGASSHRPRGSRSPSHRQAPTRRRRRA